MQALARGARLPRPGGIDCASLLQLDRLQNKAEWIISNITKSNLTNLSLPSHGSPFALMEEKKVWGEVGVGCRSGGNRETVSNFILHMKGQKNLLLCLAEHNRSRRSLGHCNAFSEAFFVSKKSSDCVLLSLKCFLFLQLHVLLYWQVISTPLRLEDTNKKFSCFEKMFSKDLHEMVGEYFLEAL